ncbi:MAG: oligosaccharide flippase family protein [Saprospiraceae bacterium]|nr:oligosaccharide flippase family protein [Saprospiraceae bacterium]
MEEKRTSKFYVGKLLTGSIAMMLSEASMKMVMLIILPIMTYYLSPRDFGIIASIKMVEGFLMMFFNPGVISGTTRLYYDTEDIAERRTLIGGSLLFFLILGIITTTALLIAGEDFFGNIFNEFELYPFGIVAILASVLIQPKRLWSALLSFQFKIPKIALFSVIRMIIDVSISIYLVTILLWGVEGRVVGMVSGIVFTFIVAMITLLRYVKGYFSLRKMWQILKFSLPLAPAIWAYSALDIADRFLIEHFIGLNDLGIYSIAYILSSAPLFVSLGFRKMWEPIFYENMNNNNYKGINSLIKTFVVVISLICSCLILFSEELTTVVLAKDFSAASTIIPWVTLGVFFLGILPISNSFITYEKKFKRISVNAAISAVINIFLNIILLPRIGIVGSAIATFISYLIYFILNLWVVGSLFIKVTSFRIFVVPLLILFLTIIIYFSLELTILSFIIKILFLLVILIFVLVIYFNKREKAFVKSFYLGFFSKKSKEI